jgi:hypothetical protein
MFTDPYIEALLVDEELADMVWELWDRGVLLGAASEVHFCGKPGASMGAT